MKLEPESIRPWKLLLEVYQHAVAVQGSANDDVQIIQLANGAIRIEMGGGNRRPGWLQAHEARARILRAYREIIERAPDQLSERRRFIDHLEGAQLHDQMIEQARFILTRLPADANLRFRMADVIRRLVAPDGDIDPRSVVMVGDRPETDGLFATTLGAHYAQVRTGVLAPRDHIPDNVDASFDVADLAALADALIGSQ